MACPTHPEMLAAWERGLEQEPVERGLTLLGLGCPDHTRAALVALSIGERDRRLLGLREALFGPHLQGLVACPRCGEQLELDVATGDLSVGSPPDPDALRLQWDDCEIQLRLPDSADLMACAEAVPDDGDTMLLRRCIAVTTPDGSEVTADSLPPAVIEQAGAMLSAADPQADMRFALSCAACDFRWSALFDIVSFLWAELDAWAARILQDVHLLASCYGWSERDILGLSPVRRQAYLRMLGE